MRTLPIVVLACFLALPTCWAAPGRSVPEPPSGFNVHLVEIVNGHRFWRGGAPTEKTMSALVAASRARGVMLTLIDLRKPANKDDRSGKGGRMSPAAEQRAVAAAGESVRYQALSALAKDLTSRIAAALRTGDVYVHCMYGVNRTGFAIGRHAASTGRAPNRKGLGERDYRQGVAYHRAGRGRTD